MLRSLTISNALQGQNHQHRATPCDCRTEPLQALKGQEQSLYWLTPFDFRRAQPFRLSVQGLNWRVCPFHRALPDAHAKRLSAFFDTVRLRNMSYNKDSVWRLYPIIIQAGLYGNYIRSNILCFL